MFRVIARYAPAVVAFGVLTTGPFGLSAYGADVAAGLPSVTVRYTDLNLNTSAGVETLYSRLRAAARTVCDVREQRPLAEAVKSNACYRQVLDAAVGSAKLLTLNARQRAGGTDNDLS